MHQQWFTPEKRTHEGQYVILRPLDPDTDCTALYHSGHATVSHLETWRYLPYGPFKDEKALYEWLVIQAKSTDPLFHTVIDKTTNTPVGIITVMSIVASAGRAELGHIWYDARVQRTPVTTESVYLLLRYMFDELNYRRMEWKCDNRNIRSKNAAQRLGFRYEGLFRKHLIVKSQNRDTAWFSMIDDEWPTQKQRFTEYLARPFNRLARG
ncbi:MAG: hypothetical protein RI985_965 [Chloroflexota bacterium]|jgi:RimJ/RimL family protein N-acetyltransferase